MKVVLCLLVLVVAAYSAPRILTDVEKRAGMDTLGLDNRQLSINGPFLTEIVCGIVDLGGRNATAAQCEVLCHQVLSGQTIPETPRLCRIICESFQKLDEMFLCD